jgi:signal transduction histidine kinase
MAAVAWFGMNGSMTAALSDMGGAPGAWVRQRARLLDLLVASVVFVYNLPIIAMYASDPLRYAAVLAVSFGLCLPWLVRRRYPLSVNGALLAAAWAQLPLDAPIIAADVMLVFAVYNTATRYRWQVSVPAAVTPVVWLLLVVAPRRDALFVTVDDLGLLVVVVAWVWTWGTLVRIRRAYITGLQERASQLEREREALARIAVADERARITREVHDIVSHSLSVVVVMADGAASKVEAEPERAKSAMIAVRDTGRTALAEMRRMLGVLREEEPGSQAPQPGTAQLDRLVEESSAAGLPVSLTVQGTPAALPAGLDLTVYRIVQEALTNARKHAGPTATIVEVRLVYGPGTIEIRVRDDGIGADPADLDGGGHGLVGMRERTVAYGGSFQAEPRPGGGFEVLVVLPMEDGT